jgi:hypothetical protein
MSDLQQEVASLRREMAELRSELEAVRSASQQPGRQPWEQLSDHLKQELTRSGEPAAIGLARQVVLQRGQDRCSSSSNQSMWTFRGDLSTDAQKVIDLVTFWASHPLAVRVLHELLGRFLQGEPMAVPKAELAQTLGVSEAELEQELRPFVANETLQWKKTATGEEAYELIHSDTFIQLLSLAHG